MRSKIFFHHAQWENYKIAFCVSLIADLRTADWKPRTI
jgi:hypothetical protein